MKLAQALTEAAPRRPRILRNLKIDDVSSVDQGAGRGVRVVLTKRHKEADMAKGTCPRCGHQDEMEKFGGRLVGKSGDADVETVHKAVQITHRSIADELMKRNPGMSLDRAMIAATSTPEFSKLHVDERRQRLGY